jgi:DNA-binding GntR family transcriptional regulator
VKDPHADRQGDGQVSAPGPSQPSGNLQQLTRRPPLTLQLYELIRRALLSGEFDGLQRLTEQELAKRFGVSRTPVREALQRLAISRLLTPAEGGGYVPRRPDERQLREILELRALLEVEAAALAAAHASEEQIETLQRAARAHRAEAATATTGILEIDDEFHRLVARASANAVLARVIAFLSERLTAYRRLELNQEGGASQPSVGHDRVAQAIASRDEAAARQLMLAHLREVERDLLSVAARGEPGPQAVEHRERSTSEGPSLSPPSHPEIQQSSLGAEAYVRLREAILSGELEPGTRLSEARLASLLGVSRTPIRDALRRLELENFVLRDEKRRVIVQHLSETEVHEVFHLRQLLEGYACRLAAERISDAELEKLEELIAADFEACRHDRIHDLARLNDQIHDLLVVASRNRLLRMVIQDLRQRIPALRIFAFGSGEENQLGVREHAEILNLVRAGRATEAQQTMWRHLARTRDMLLAHLASTSEQGRSGNRQEHRPVASGFVGSR